MHLPYHLERLPEHENSKPCNCARRNYNFNASAMKTNFSIAIIYCARKNVTMNRRNCSSCGESGHNIRTCPKLHPEKFARRRGNLLGFSFCSNCGEQGHNLRTCEQLHPERATKRKLRNRVVKALRRCSICNAQGHNSRTCTA